MIPKSNAAGDIVSLTRNGINIQTTVEKIKGVNYIFFDALEGTYIATYSNLGGSDKRLVKESN